MSVTVYSYPNSYRVFKALIAARYNNVVINTPDFKMGEGNKEADFLSRFPAGKVPAADTPHGPLYESNAIARYVARLRADTQLLGDDVYSQALVDQWIDFTAFELEPIRGMWLYPIYGIYDFNPKAYGEAKRDIARVLKIVDDHLLRNTYLVGNHVTLADITLACAYLDLYKDVLTPDFTKKYVNVTRWFETLLNQEEFHAVLGDVKQAVTEKKADMSKKPAVAEKKGEKVEKKKDEKKADKPKAEKKEAKKDESADLEEQAAAEEAAKKKQKNPLDELPPSTMVLDTVKKLAFSERPFYSKFFEQFWPMFDAQGYSIYTCNYKHMNDYKVFFLACNLMGGYIQRCDPCRKYAFGAMSLTGKSEDEAPWKMVGVWVFRGPEMIAEMKNVDDTEYFDWVKLDTSDPAARKKVEEYFVADSIGGEEVLDRRYFK